MTRVAVPAPAGQRVEVTSLLTHQCPFKDEVDNGTVTLSWTTVSHTLELHALKAWLLQYRDTRISHEQLNRDLQTGLAEVHGITDVRVESKWHTADMRVVVCST